MVINMPALHTHYKFGQDVLKKVNHNIQKEINKEIDYYNVFNQGFDNLYYHIKWNYYKKLGVKFHKKNVDIFFKNTFEYIKNNNLQNNNQIINLVYGFINHYTLDTIIHPYVNYQVKNLNISHTKIEFIIDTILSEQITGKTFKILIPKLKFDYNLLNCINYVFEKTHNEKNIGKIFNKSHNNGYYLYRYFIHDKYGIKTFIYKIIDFLLPLKKFKLNKNTYYIKKIDYRVLNSEKSFWHHPKNELEKYDFSFKELYNISQKICINLINEAYEIIHNNKEPEKFLKTIKIMDLKNISQLLEK